MPKIALVPLYRNAECAGARGTGQDRHLLPLDRKARQELEVPLRQRARLRALLRPPQKIKVVFCRSALVYRRRTAKRGPARPFGLFALAIDLSGAVQPNILLHCMDWRPMLRGGFMTAETSTSGFRLHKVLDWISLRTWLVLIPVLFTAFLLTKAFKENDFKFFYDEDGRQYYQTALEITEHGLFLSPLDGDTSPYAFRLPFYQTFLSFFVRPPSVPGAFQPLHAALELSYCSLIFLGFMIAGNLMTGILALCCAFAFSYYNLHYGIDVEVQVFYAMMVALFTLCGVNFLNRRTRFSALLWGVSAGLSLQVRSALFAFVALCAIILALKQKYRSHALIFFTAVSFIILPLTIRNYRLFHQFIPFEKDAALENMYSASVGIVKPGDFNMLDTLEAPLKEEFTNGDNAVKYRILRAAIRRNLVSHPWRYIKGFFKRLLYCFEICLMLLPVLLFALYKKEPIPLFIGSLCCYYILIHSLMIVRTRYFFPIQMPVYILSFYMIDTLFFHKGRARNMNALKRTEWTAIAFICTALLVYARQSLILLREVRHF